MERLKPRLAIAKQAHATLTEALRTENPTALERDGAIQRFEYTFEVCWKLCQAVLENRGRDRLRFTQRLLAQHGRGRTAHA